MAGGKAIAGGLAALTVVPVGAVLAITLLVAGVAEDEEAQRLEQASCVVSDDSGAAAGGLQAVPNGWGPLVEAAAKEAGLPASVVAAQLNQESGWNENATSPVGAQGVAQFMPATWAAYGNGGDPFSATDAIPAYGRYMAALKKEVQSIADDDANLLVQLTLAAYNAGPGAVQQYDGIPPFQETQKYVSTILDTAQSGFSMDCAAPTGGKPWDGDLGDGEWTTPLPGGKFTSGYGQRNIPNLPVWAQNHVGVDIATPGAGYGNGGTVVAPTDLRVTSILPEDNCVIARENGDDPDFVFGFCHLNSYAVKVGDELKRGDVIGVEGNKAGLGSVMTHLHLEIYSPEAPDKSYPYNNFNIDPEPILKEKGARPE
ncbi:transglycosylase SLT domain-containing protein (plasmid) [Arthrobacter agilis]|uniref:transglycosylase SLT domain-containing protein n=1 Tax=Arthrobacter agilis TaxID=37921 RepID=UPI002365A83A|nr:transglycosylase SLT domain-containing protein [Arthrobacter agilis]WDF35183.1 transglycosylase SLT domain-containing protein [Arthrobacter agilis]